jgi:hypothetical protein
MKLKTLFLIGVTLLASGFLVFFLTKYQKANTATAELNLPKVVQASTENYSQESADGKVTLNMKKETNNDLVTYTFTSSTGSFYTQTLTSNISMSIPVNTWSPDNKYFFIKESGSENIYLVISPLGESTNINDKFKAKYTDYVITDVTGWAAPNLLIVNTNKLDDTKGPSIWFDITSGGFTILSTRFD